MTERHAISPPPATSSRSTATRWPGHWRSTTWQPTRTRPKAPEADAIAAQARIALKAAADRAIALGAHVQAVTYLRQALPLITDPVEEAAAVGAAGRSASRAARHEEATELLERAIELNRARGRSARNRGVDRESWARHCLTIDSSRERLALLTDAVREFPDPREPGVAAMHGQLARAHMFVSDFPSALAVAEPTLAAAEELDLSAVLADTLITKGSALGTMGRPFEAMALEVAARDLAQRLNLAWLELRAITNIGLLMASDDPVAGVQLMKEGMALAERVGVRNDVLTANGIEFAIPTGEWEWARATMAEHLATDVGRVRPAHPVDRGR